MTKKPWTRNQKIAFIVAMATVATVIVGVFGLYLKSKDTTISTTLVENQKTGINETTILKPEVKIINPKERDAIPYPVTIRGNLSGTVPAGKFVWLITHPHSVISDMWWPNTSILPTKGEWEVDVRIGDEEQDAEERFDLVLVLVDSFYNQSFKNFIQEAEQANKWYPAIDIPELTISKNILILDKITVVRNRTTQAEPKPPQAD